MILSVIITVYNQAKYVEKTINSVLSQKTDFDFEVIIADDASVDGSDKIIQQYADKYDCIIFIKNKENIGAIRNYAQCLKKAKGKYIADLGGDDFWINDLKLQKQIGILEQREDVGMVYTQYDTLVTESGKYTSNCMKQAEMFSGRIFDDMLLYKTNINIGTSCFRRQLIECLIPKFENKDFLCEDLPMWLQICKSHNIEFMPLSTMCYRINAESLSHSNDMYKNLYYNDEIERIRVLFANDNDRKELIQSIKNEADIRRFVVCLRDKTKRRYYYSLIKEKGLIIRVLKVLPFRLVLVLHSFYLRVKRKRDVASVW